jgi:hypothetical protein
VPWFPEKKKQRGGAKFVNVRWDPMVDKWSLDPKEKPKRLELTSELTAFILMYCVPLMADVVITLVSTWCLCLEDDRWPS